MIYIISLCAIYISLTLTLYLDNKDVTPICKYIKSHAKSHFLTEMFFKYKHSFHLLILYLLTLQDILFSSNLYTGLVMLQNSCPMTVTIRSTSLYSCMIMLRQYWFLLGGTDLLQNTFFRYLG
jgi:hypothetical protein